VLTVAGLVSVQERFEKWGEELLHSCCPSCLIQSDAAANLNEKKVDTNCYFYDISLKLRTAIILLHRRIDVNEWSDKWNVINLRCLVMCWLWLDFA
jgi:predicted adenine nucleotide alpha hydrolase (AANH) superfamily ATPase